MPLVSGITVQYSVVYPARVKTKYNPCSVETPPIPDQPVSVEIPEGGTALDVMEIAYNSQHAYKFTATFSEYGFFVNAINGIPCAVIQSPPSQCFWGFFIQYPNGTVSASNLGVSSYEFTDDGYGMIMCFTDSLDSFDKNCNSDHKFVKEEL